MVRDIECASRSRQVFHKRFAIEHHNVQYV
jgi:hypothetical protein